MLIGTQEKQPLRQYVEISGVRAGWSDRAEQRVGGSQLLLPSSTSRLKFGYQFIQRRMRRLQNSSKPDLLSESGWPAFAIPWLRSMALSLVLCHRKLLADRNMKLAYGRHLQVPAAFCISGLSIHVPSVDVRPRPAVAAHSAAAVFSTNGSSQIGDLPVEQVVVA